MDQQDNPADFNENKIINLKLSNSNIDNNYQSTFKSINNKDFKKKTRPSND
jgi:hypothetical protein